MNYLTRLVAVCICLLIMHAEAYAQKNATLLGKKTYNEELNDVWGYTAPDGSEYALVGLSTGISVVDIRDLNELVEVGRTEGRPSVWRDMKTWGEYAYAVDDQSGEGLIIIDLRDVPNSIDYTIWNGDGDFSFSTAHNIFIDENGIGYLFGANYSESGAVMLDLTGDPLNPTVVGLYDEAYVHDGFVRGDTLWTAEIYSGTLNAIDIKDKWNPVKLGSVTTPSSFAHNCWISDDNKVAFTTDEVDDAYLAAYDVSDVTDIKELDRIQSNPGNRTVPHNTFIYKDWLVTSYYKDGLTVHDITYPDNMIQVGDFDTNPLTGGQTFGAWGVYPYLPSETVLVTDMNEGLFVIRVNYTKGAYLQGKVTHDIVGIELADVKVEITGVPTSKKKSKIDGKYSTGVADDGFYEVTFSKPGFESLTITDVGLSTGVVNTLDVSLFPLTPFTLTGNIVDDNGSPIPNANVVISNEDFTYSALTDATGAYKLPGFYEGNYDYVVGAWGYETKIISAQDIPLNADPYNYTLRKGIYEDDFILNYNWVVAHNSPVDQGIWERTVPIGTGFGFGPVNPDEDVAGDIGNMCYVTGNQEDTDWFVAGESSLVSPIFDLSGFEVPELSYYTWFVNVSNGEPSRDSMNVYVSNGQTEILLETINRQSLNSSFQGWQQRAFQLGELIELTDQMRLRFDLRAIAPQDLKLVEAGVDAVKIVDLLNMVGVADELEVVANSFAMPNPFNDYTTIFLEGETAINTAATVSLFNINGQEVSRQIMRNGQATFSRNDLAQGIYFYAIENEKGAVIGKGKVVVKN